MTIVSSNWADQDRSCALCGTKCYLSQCHVHHLIERGVDITKKDDPDNLITLCASCHDRIHQDYDKLRNLRKTANRLRRSELYGGEYEWE